MKHLMTDSKLRKRRDKNQRSQVRFNEGGLDGCLWATLNGYEAENGGYNQGVA